MNIIWSARPHDATTATHIIFADHTGLVNTHMGWLDIFAAPGLSLRLLVALVHVSVTAKHAESEAAEVPTRCPPSAWQKAA